MTKMKTKRRGSRSSCRETQPWLFPELQPWPKGSRSIHWLVQKSSVTPRKKSKKHTRDSFVSIMAPVNDSGRVIGEEHRNARYLDEDVEHARELVASGQHTLREISQMLDMPIRTIRDYASGRRRNQSIAGWRKIKRKA